MLSGVRESGLRQTSAVLYITVDNLIPASGRAAPGFDEFTATLDHAGIPAVWLTNRTRLQMDEPRRKYAHNHPFIAEGGCGIFLPEDYFHLRPTSGPSPSRKSTTLRLGRFTCIPIATPHPAAAEALETLSQDTAVCVVALRSLSPRELAQNSGLPSREADLARQRDFDELFFFAGASAQDIGRFLAEGRRRRFQLRQRGVLWSLAVDASPALCVRELSRLYNRALRTHAVSIGISTPAEEDGLFSACDRAVLLESNGEQEILAHQFGSRHLKRIPLSGADTWVKLIESVRARN